jgi:serine/threonine-protein kinase
VNPGDTISRYRIVARIGKGGMGVVYRAEDTRLRRPVALKFLPDSLDEGRKHRFLNEARAAALARHPNICPIHDIEEADGEIFLVMALIEGETISRRVSRGRILPAEAVAIATQVAAGLAAAHDLGIVHRDIKGSNLMIDAAGHVSIMDFGLALAPDAMRLTGEGASVGTPDYMSPEQAEGKDVDGRTDLWSFGVVLFEMLTGHLPFRRENKLALIHAILNDPIPEMPGVPDNLQQIVRKALARNPADRWPTARAMLRALQGEPDSEHSETETHIQTRTQTIAGAPRRGRPWSAIVAALVVLMALAGLGFYRFQGPDAPAIPAAKHIAMIPVEGDSAVANGIQDAVAAALAAQSGVTVVPAADLRTIKTVDGARKYHGVNLAIALAGKPGGEGVDFTIDLIDAVRNQPIASRPLRYDVKNPVVSRDQAVSQVFRMLNLQAPPVKPADSSAPEASSAYLEGRGYLARYDISENTDKAIVSFTRATGQDPNYALAYAGLAEAYWRKSRIAKDAKWRLLAIQNGEHAARIDPKLPMAHAVLGLAWRDSAKEAEAIQEFMRALELAPNHAEASRQLAEIYAAQGKAKEAEALYLRATQTRPTDWYGFFLLGLFYFDLDRDQEAIAALNQAKQLAADNHLVRYNLGAIHRAHGRYDEALAEIQQGLKVRSTASLYSLLGGVYFYKHRFPEAVAALETATELSPRTYQYWGNLGIYAKWAPGNEAKMEPALRRATELALKAAEANPTEHSVRANLAEYRARLGDATGALAELDRIPETVRRPLAVRFALVYELTGQRDQAIAVIRQSLRNASSLNQIKDDPDLAAVWRAVQ